LDKQGYKKSYIKRKLEEQEANTELMEYNPENDNYELAKKVSLQVPRPQHVDEKGRM
jgi:hypothetical protein